MISRYLKKWSNMIFNKGVLHANKGVSKRWEKNEIKGFYIDYSVKVENKNIDDDGLPYNILANGKRVRIPITIIQYGLGSYEKYLETNEEMYRCSVMRVAEYLISTQRQDGGWDAFVDVNKNLLRSSMVQSEAAALLLRTYILSKDERYFNSAKLAIDQMLLPIKDGGASDYLEDQIVFYEFVGKDVVLNGWIYSLFGLFDYWIVTQDASLWRIIEITKKTLINYLPKFDIGYWSKYDLGKTIASPFYHNLHITQLGILYDMFGDEEFNLYKIRWESYRAKKCYVTRAFIIKAFQKLKLVNANDIIE